MPIRIGDDGTIISTDGDIQQGQNPLIGGDGTIRLDEQPVPSFQSEATRSRRPPISPLENTTDNSREESSSAVPSSASTQARSTSAPRSESTIEYELQVKRAELRKCIRAVPVIICIVFILLAILFSNLLLAAVSAIAIVPITMDISKRSKASEEIRKLETELETARSRSNG